MSIQNSIASENTLQNGGEIKTLLMKQKLRECVTNRHKLQEMGHFVYITKISGGFYKLKGSYPRWKPDSRWNIQEGMKSTKRGKYVGKYKRLFFIFLIFKRCLNVEIKIIASIVGFITYVEIKHMTKQHKRMKYVNGIIMF